MKASWTWQFSLSEEPAVAPITDAPEVPSSFSTQSEAESWIGAHWRELQQQGVHSAMLCRNGSHYAEPISLRLGR